MAITTTQQATALIQLLSKVAHDVGMQNHSYIVGGAVRDWHLSRPLKDVDVVVEPFEGRKAIDLAEALAKTLGGLSVKADQYGVVHVGPVKLDIFFDGINLRGQKVEIVTSRKERYNRGSHKPCAVEPGTILEDLQRRDFTINTLVWRLSDMLKGPLDDSQILDLTGEGLNDLRAGIIRTPLEPNVTFSDDPSRMLRAVRFAVKYGFEIEAKTRAALITQAEELKRMPYEAIDGLFFKMLKLPKAHHVLRLLRDTRLDRSIVELIPVVRFHRMLSLEAYTIKQLLLFDRFDYPTVLRKMEDFRVLFHKLDTEGCSESEIQTVVKRLVQPPIDMVKLKEMGLSGKELGAAQSAARMMIAADPFASDAKIQQAIIDLFTKQAD